MTPAIVFDTVWKKFRRGERHDSLRDLIPAMLGQALRRHSTGELGRDDFWVLKDVSFEVKPGEALGIIGQNGAGKSTTLKLLTKILRPTRGHCCVRGRVGALIEVAAGFHPDLTGRENVYLQGAIMGMNRYEIRRRFDEIVAFAGVEEFIDTPVKRYSTGMNARLGFSIAAHLEPEVLLIDEVLAVGDFTFQQKCHERMRDFLRGGTAIAFVSHNMQAVATLCTRAILLRTDNIPISGSATDVVAEYVSSVPSASDPRVEVKESLLSKSDGTPTVGGIAPGSVLRLHVTVRAVHALPRCGVALKISRADGAVMFYGASNVGGAVTKDVPAGAELSFAIIFSANLLKGTYIISAQLLDTRRVWPTITLNGIGSFVVVETTRIDGCAELSPSYQLSLGAVNRTQLQAV